MHGWTCCIDRVEHDEIAVAFTATLKADDRKGMTRSLEINGR